MESTTIVPEEIAAAAGAMGDAFEVVEVEAAAVAAAEEEFEELEESTGDAEEEDDEDDDEEDEEEDDDDDDEETEDHVVTIVEKKELATTPPPPISTPTTTTTTTSAPTPTKGEKAQTTVTVAATTVTGTTGAGGGAGMAVAQGLAAGAGPRLRVKLTGIQPSTTKETLVRVFGKFGSLMWVTVMSTGTEPPFGLAVFKMEQDAATAAREIDGAEIDGAVVHTVLHAPPARLAKPPKVLPAGPRLRLRVDGVAATTTQEALGRAFARVGNVSHTRIISSPTGPFGLVDFATEQDALTAAGEMEGKEFDGSILRISVQSVPVKAPKVQKSPKRT
jgi:hypothetical protein